jgi:hypothetical protein
MDVDHQPTDLAVGGSNPSRRAPKPQFKGLGLLALLVSPESDSSLSLPEGLPSGARVIYRRGRSMRVMVYARRDPLTGKKKWVSRQVPGTGRAALKEAKQVEAKLLGEVAAGRHQEAHGVKVAELVDRWLEWRHAVSPCHRGRPPTASTPTKVDSSPSRPRGRLRKESP